MNANNSPKRRIYVYYFLGILFSATLVTIDIFSDKGLSKNLNETVNILLPQQTLNSNDFKFSSLEIFKTKSSLINENIRLKNEVIELRKLLIENEQLRDENINNNRVVKEVDTAIYNILQTSIIFKTHSDEYIISGGENLNLKVKDLVIDQSGYVVAIVTGVRQDRSFISTIEDSNFSIQGIDKYGNEYLITSDGEYIFVNSLKLNTENSDIKYIYTDISYGHPGQFPIVDLSSTQINIANNKLQAEIPINYKISFFSDLYLIQAK